MKKINFLFISFCLLATSPTWARTINDDLIEAAGWDDTFYMDELVKKGADVNGKNENGETALMIAGANNLPGTINFLLSRDANVNAKDNRGNTAIMYAANNGAPKSARLLTNHYKYPADLNLKNKNGETALMFAARYGNTEVAGILLGEKAEINVKDINGMTPLMIAAYNGHLKMVEELFRWSLVGTPNIMGKNKAGKTAIDLAKDRNHTNISDYLEKRIKDNLDFDLWVAARDGKLKKVKELIVLGADVNQKGIFSSVTILSIARKNGHLKIVEVLKKAGAKE